MAESTSSKKAKGVASAAPASKTSASKKAVSAAKTTVTKVAAKTAPKVAPKAATKAAAVKKPAPEVVKTPKVAAAPKRSAGAKKKAAEISYEQRSHYIEVAAYFIAERRGFAEGDTLQDWVVAEAQVDQLLKDGKLGG